MRKTKVSFIALWITAIILCTFGLLILTKQQNDKMASLTPFEQVTKGMTKERVLEIMGNPDFELDNSYLYDLYGVIEFEERGGRCYVSRKLSNDEIKAVLKEKDEDRKNGFQMNLSGEK